MADKLREDRVRRVIEPLLSGSGEARHHAQDLEYVRDLGLVARGDPPRIANPIYAEVAPRELTHAVQSGLLQETAWYVDDGGRLDMEKLLAAFATFYGEHAEHWMGRFDYVEAGPQLVLQAFLQRVVNSGGGASSGSTASSCSAPAAVPPGLCSTNPGGPRRGPRRSA